MEAVEYVVKPVQEFAKDSVRLVKRCHKPDRKGALQRPWIQARVDSGALRLVKAKRLSNNHVESFRGWCKSWSCIPSLVHFMASRAPRCSTAGFVSELALAAGPLKVFF